MIRHLLSVTDLSVDEIWELISMAQDMKDGVLCPEVKKVVSLLFEKPSLRTRVSFEVAMWELGGKTIYLSSQDVGWGKREELSDMARTLSRYVDGMIARTFEHHTLELLAEGSNIPVINALSDREHPCQALSDLLTIYEKKGDVSEVRLSFIGDGNNVAHSLLLLSSMVGMSFVFCSPPKYRPREDVWSKAQSLAQGSGCHLEYISEPRLAVREADVVYTDVWTSMGQEEEADIRRKSFSGYQVNPDLLSYAKKDAIFMHPLPAHHGEEMSPGFLSHPSSVVFDQAENRLHTQKAILAWIFS
jgi:ornithine carbamoyltransferase